MKQSRNAKLDLLLIHTEAAYQAALTPNRVLPLSLLPIASTVETAGFSVKILDTRHPEFSLSWFQDYLKKYQPRWVGFSTVTDTMFVISKLCQVVRHILPQTQILVGGPHATFADVETFLRVSPDIIVRGEGERSVIDILSEKDFENIKGISFRTDQKIIQTPLPEAVDINTLPQTNYQLIEDLKLMNYQAALVTTRGCPYRCTFCSPALNPHPYRTRNIDLIIDDIQNIQQSLNSKYVMFYDDTFTLSHKRVKEFCKKVAPLKPGQNFFWFANGRADRLTKDPKLIPMMKDAGARMILLGAESGDKKVLQAYDKEITTEMVEEVALQCRKSSILFFTTFILGGAFESRETLKNTREFCHRLFDNAGPFLSFRFFFFTPLPGTLITRHPERYDLTILDPQLATSSDYDNCVSRTKHLSREEIMYLGQEMISSLMKRQQSEVEAANPAFKEMAKKLMDSAGPIHISLLPPHLIDENRIDEIIRTLWDKAASDSSILFKDGTDDSFPIRFPKFKMNEHGSFCFPVLNIDLTAEQSAIFNYCAGKLTKKEITTLFITEKSYSSDQIQEVFEFLQKESLILFSEY